MFFSELPLNWHSRSNVWPTILKHNINIWSLTMLPILFDCFILILISAESRIALIGFQFLIDLRGQHHFWIPLLTVFSPKLTVQITPFIINIRKVSSPFKLKSQPKSFYFTVKIFRPARRTNPEHAIRFTDPDRTLKSMTPADNLLTAGYYILAVDGDK